MPAPSPEPAHRGELAFYRCYSPQPVTLAALVKAAGLHWTIDADG